MAKFDVITFGIVLSYVALILGSSIMQEFKTNSSMSDKTCGVDKVFNKPGVVNSLICAGKCYMNEACVTFAYSNITGQCDGCGNFYKSVTSLDEDMPGSEYYTPTRNTGYIYVGCFKKIGSNPMLRMFGMVLNLTVELCSELCDAFDLPFFGLKYGDVCHCLDEFYGQLGTSTNCTSPCFGNNTQICGGDYEASIYKYTYRI